MKGIKRLLSSADLAINGAPPAYDEPLHVGRPNLGDRERFKTLVDGIFERGQLTNNGPLVRDLEDRIADYLGVAHCVAVANGTCGLEILIKALGMTGEVIVPSYTFVATAHAVRWLGGTPVFADISAATHNLDPAAVERAITPDTTGIIGVHLWGRAAPVEPLQEIADAHGIPLAFDAAHAFGCSHEGRMLGNFGGAEVLSFHATKFFNSFEGGAVVTNDAELAHSLKRLRNFGFAGIDDVRGDGTNAKMAEICAAMGLVNLDLTDEVIERNERNFASYQAALQDVSGLTLLPFDLEERNNFQYVVIEVGENCAAGRDALVDALRAENVLARKYFWPACHRMEPYRSLPGMSGSSLPETERVADRVMVLPTGSSVDAGDIEFICRVLRILVDDA